MTRTTPWEGSERTSQSRPQTRAPADYCSLSAQWERLFSTAPFELVTRTATAEAWRAYEAVLSEAFAPLLTRVESTQASSPHVQRPATPESGSVDALRAENSRHFLELQQLKTKEVFAARELREKQAEIDRLRQEIERLKTHNDNELACIHEQITANRELQIALINREAGRLAMHERQEGVVVRVYDEAIAVEYNTANGPLEQVYQRSQFVGAKLPDEGYHIEAHVFAWWEPHVPKGIDRFLTPEEIDNVNRASEKGTSGPRDI